jgi:hypothetical protein
MPDQLMWEFPRESGRAGMTGALSGWIAMSCPREWDESDRRTLRMPQSCIPHAGNVHDSAGSAAVDDQLRAVEVSSAAVIGVWSRCGALLTATLWVQNERNSAAGSLPPERVGISETFGFRGQEARVWVSGALACNLR